MTCWICVMMSLWKNAPPNYPFGYHWFVSLHTIVLIFTMTLFSIGSCSASLFLESLCIGEQWHITEWIVRNISHIIKKYPNIVYADDVTNNNSANKNTCTLLKIEFFDKFFQKCILHVLHLYFRCNKYTERSKYHCNLIF